MRITRKLTMLCLVMTVGTLMVACGGDDDNGDASAPPTTAVETPTEGGSLVFGAEQEPDCADWIAICAGASWGVYTMQAHTMPRTFDVTPDSKYKVNPMLVEEPKLEPGPPQKLTYKINPKAVWSDGQPITSTDFKYTWDQIVNGKDIYDTTGYKDIASVDDTDPKTAVVTFKNNFAAWRDMFGGFYGIYPSHLLQGKDRNAEMKDGYKWSGGPWMIDNWTKGQGVTLVPNPSYWDKKPHLNSVTFKFLPDTAAEQQAYKSNQVSMIYPQAQLELTQLKGLPDTAFDVKTGLQFEGLWFNVSTFPVDDINVRKALAYATDRTVIVQQLFGPVQNDIKPINAFVTPANTEYYTDPFKIYTRDLNKVNELMTGAGWTKGADGIWEKGGKKANVTSRTTAGNKRRELTQQLLQSQWKEAGFNFAVDNQRSGTLFGQTLPAGDFVKSIYAQTPTLDPGLCNVFCSFNIPSSANGNVGNNWTRANDKPIDTAWDGADKELDSAKRRDLTVKGQQALADYVPAIPLDPFPDVVVYNTRSIGGPVGHNFVFGPWMNMNEFFVRK